MDKLGSHHQPLAKIGMAIRAIAAAGSFAVLSTCIVGCSTVEAAAGAQPQLASKRDAWLIVCRELADPDATRLLLSLATETLQVLRFEIVTPDFVWHLPGQPETARFPAAESDVSPDLADALEFTVLADAEHELRLLDFAAPQPEAVQLEGLRGSLALHESWHNNRAVASLFHTATGNILNLAGVHCQRFASQR